MTEIPGKAIRYLIISAHRNMKINFEKNIVQTDSRNYTYDDLEDIFTDMETEEYVNVSSRFVKWQKERIVSGLSHFHM